MTERTQNSPVASGSGLCAGVVSSSGGGSSGTSSSGGGGTSSSGGGTSSSGGGYTSSSGGGGISSASSNASISGGSNVTIRKEIDVITVQIAPEKKGLFLKHSEYEVNVFVKIKINPFFKY